VGAILALLWAWMAIAYHALHFTAINPAAPGFAAIFLAGAAAFAWAARGAAPCVSRPRPRASPGGRGSS
jgi:hypothetical protein